MESLDTIRYGQRRCIRKGNTASLASTVVGCGLANGGGASLRDQPRPHNTDLRLGVKASQLTSPTWQNCQCPCKLKLVAYECTHAGVCLSRHGDRYAVSLLPLLLLWCFAWRHKELHSTGKMYQEWFVWTSKINVDCICLLSVVIVTIGQSSLSLQWARCCCVWLTKINPRWRHTGQWHITKCQSHSGFTFLDASGKQGEDSYCCGRWEEREAVAIGGKRSKDKFGEEWEGTGGGGGRRWKVKGKIRGGRSNCLWRANNQTDGVVPTNCVYYMV